MKMGELAVAILQIEFDRTSASSRSAADLRDPELETIGHVNADPMFGACHGVANGFARHLKEAGYLKMRPTCLDIDLKRDRLEQRLVFGRAHRAEDPPDRGHLLCLLTRQDLQERGALRELPPAPPPASRRAERRRNTLLRSECRTRPGNYRGSASR